MKYIDSTSVIAQQNFILSRLTERPHSTNELRGMGIYYPPSRVRELRTRGYLIDTFFRYETDPTGLKHRVGVYVLHENQTSQGELTQ
ncbi:helix-turn-helix domain-containing protein [Haemophilus pittmaniae]|uniref:helix-turn-helix domain-containing protein n=1 Tax=Haemophilus pittmaniae TaxID=249188 RepID=UPI0028DB876A|nr:helix-turn-helix domain-containing protein [Haemophilus pittmaniae]